MKTYEMKIGFKHLMNQDLKNTYYLHEIFQDRPQVEDVFLTVIYDKEELFSTTISRENFYQSENYKLFINKEAIAS